MMRYLDSEKQSISFHNTYGGETEAFGVRRLNFLIIIIYSLNFEDRLRIDEFICNEFFANILNVIIFENFLLKFSFQKLILKFEWNNFLHQKVQEFYFYVLQKQNMSLLQNVFELNRLNS